MEPATKNDLYDLRSEMKGEFTDVGFEMHRIRKMLEEDIQAIAEDVRSTNRFLVKMIEKYDRRLDDHGARITKLENS